MSVQGANHADIVLIDSDPALREAITQVFARRGLHVRCYGSTADFAHDLAHLRPSCILMETHEGEESGIDFLRRVGVTNLPGPVVIMSKQASVTQIVNAIRLGAIDFIEKPFDVEHLPPRICAVLTSAASATDERRAEAALQAERLTARQRQILPLVLRGMSNKAIARQIGISPRTVEVHRANIRSRLGLAHLSALIR